MWDSSEACFQHLKAAGYFIAATHLAPDSIPIADLDWTKPTVVIMGNESFGMPLAVSCLHPHTGGVYNGGSQ